MVHLTWIRLLTVCLFFGGTVLAPELIDKYVDVDWENGGAEERSSNRFSQTDTGTVSHILCSSVAEKECEIETGGKTSFKHS